MKPRILIAMHYLELGGAECALIGLLSAIDTRRVDVDLFLYDHRGELLSYIPPNVNLLPAIPSYTMLERPIVELIKNRFWRLAVARLWAKWITHISKHKNVQHLDDASCFFNMSRITTPILPQINPDVEYDLAVSFLTPHHIVLDKVRARKKVAWVHTDYTNIYIDAAMELQMWTKYDNIVAISAEAAEKFVQIFPSLTSKMVTIENILPAEMIRKRAEKFIPEDMPTHKRETILLSIGRYSNPKRFDEIPMICKRLRQLLPDYNIRWYIIGYGADEALISQRILYEGMQKHVILLGKRSNPYPYIKACDIYIQPSRYEGKSITVREAQILCKPIVITNYPTAKDQLINGVDGIIVPMEINACADGIANVIRDKNLKKCLCSYLHVHDYGKKSEIEKFYALLPENSSQGPQISRLITTNQE